MSTFLFLDLETTGLDPRRCSIVEVACVLTRDDFVPFAEFESLVHCTQDDHWEPIAFQMHSASGLRQMSENHGQPEWAVLEALRRFVQAQCATDRPNLAGNSVHFDRSFLQEWCPEFLGQLTHRHLDVSSVRLLAEAKGLPKYESGEKPHRAMADVKHSLAELDHYVSVFGKGW